MEIILRPQSAIFLWLTSWIVTHWLTNKAMRTITAWAHPPAGMFLGRDSFYFKRCLGYFWKFFMALWDGHSKPLCSCSLPFSCTISWFSLFPEILLELPSTLISAATAGWKSGETVTPIFVCPSVGTGLTLIPCNSPEAKLKFNKMLLKPVHACSELTATTQAQFSSVQSLSPVWLFATPWTEACQASLFITNSQSPLKFMSIESAMPSNHLILCRPLLLLPAIPPSIRVFSNESALRIRWPVLECQLQHQSFQWTPRTDFL